MQHPSSRAALLFVFVVGATAGADRGEVSRAIEERVGHGLRVRGRLTSPPGGFRETWTSPDGLTAEKAVSLALWNNAALRATLADLGSAAQQ